MPEEVTCRALVVYKPPRYNTNCTISLRSPYGDPLRIMQEWANIVLLKTIIEVTMESEKEGNIESSTTGCPIRVQKS